MMIQSIFIEKFNPHRPCCLIEYFVVEEQATKSISYADIFEFAVVFVSQFNSLF